jgi:hypothetical protein
MSSVLTYDACVTYDSYAHTHHGVWY